MTDMAGRAVLLVGASSAIGQAIAQRFAAHGDRVAGVSLEPLAEAAPAFAGHLAVDCSSPAGGDEAVSAATEVLGGLDVVVLAAAVMPVASAVDTTDQQWRASVDTILSGAFYVARAALRTMPPGSNLVAVTSVNATLAAPGLPAYAAAKAGVEGLVRQLALEYGPRGIRTNAVAPGMIGSVGLPKVTEGYPLQRTGTPADVAEAVFFLASDAAAFITGCVLPVDGGLSISSPAAWIRPDLRARFLCG
ncbi:MAG TPA: SDR family oxidoreductase [Trebonia sp.]|nr:SDR family oxidoreductase [Trebonia sp.]